MFMVVSIIFNLFSSQVSFADEGMWTLDNLPTKVLKSKYNFSVNEEWKKNVQLSSVRLANGCSGSFVSKDALVMTNHHCARGCIQNVSTAKKDYIENGFISKNRAQEKKCPGLEINRLLGTTDVTKEIKNAIKGLKGKPYIDARKSKMSEIEKRCAEGKNILRCDVVSLYHGGLYHLYKYQRYQDVRLVFAPEQSIAAFGGDPDNFNFPRYSLDVTFLRVYENNKPLVNKNYFPWSTQHIKEGDLTFVTGHPGRTQRLLTVAELEDTRDRSITKSLIYMSEMRGLLTQYMKKGKEYQRTAHGQLAGIENGIKAYRGRLKALQDKDFFKQLIRKEKKLRAKVASRSVYRKKYGSAWKEISATIKKSKDVSDEAKYIAYTNYHSSLFGIARKLVRAADELPKENSKRLREYSDAKIPQFKQRLYSKAPIYNDLEQTLLEFSFTKMREHLSPDHPFVKKVLRKMSPADLARKLVKGTRLGSVKVRQALFKGGKEAILKSKDPMIQLALLMDPEARALRKYIEDEINSVLNINSEKIAQAKFDIYGTKQYPDATFSLRASFGTVKGYPEKGKMITPFTEVNGLYKRQTGKKPFALPKSWSKSQKKLNGSTPFNLISTNDIIGGNSGSPMINRQGEIVGLIFDGNIHSLGGAYGFDEKLNRSVSVHSAIITESLEKVYKVKDLLKEIRGN